MFKLSSNKLLGGAIFLAFLISPAAAHNVKTDANVGATFHIEPNHNPRAGEPNRAWFALTRQGGELIPLSQCDCQLEVYAQGSAAKESPVLTPPLIAISAEQYQNIPGADIIFPQAGIYELKISGSPKSGASFKPFQLSYTVTVSPGKEVLKDNSAVEETKPIQSSSDRISSEEKPTKSVQTPQFLWLIGAIISGSIIGIISLKIAAARAKTKSK